ncbi:unnamed protein product [Dibothriocephalus latus]|uniref:Uncharacterized protein n=1 Tax=Dibothriocephalus latus TaxID=60516 RepID=A0A3P6Q2D2_DIBLA|nr:unnamed protein product [Dibothriocephalus latus]
MENLAGTLLDSNLQMTLPYGIGMHHAGLRDKDRRIVEELFVNQKIQPLCSLFIIVLPFEHMLA